MQNRTRQVHTPDHGAALRAGQPQVVQMMLPSSMFRGSIKHRWSQKRKTMTDEKNVLGEPLQACSEHPVTGFFRDGCCRTDSSDLGVHVICARVSADFLAYSLQRGNDLITPSAGSGFPGLKPGDRWCLCAARWQEALEAGAAPRVVLQATHERALEIVKLNDLKRHALDLS